MKTNKDKLGDRMKGFESLTDTYLLPQIPTMARLDGRAFHSFCRKFDKPFDARMDKAMRETTKWLVEKTGALAGYTQSDEITLMWYSDNFKNEKVFFDRRLLKMTSILASMASIRFNQIMTAIAPERINLDNPPMFDCRVWSVPTLEEAANVFLWRVEDAKRNSIQALGQAHFSHKKMVGKSNLQVLEMLIKEKGIYWESLPQHLRFGTLFQRKRTLREFTVDELAKLAPKHEARSNPELRVSRSEVFETDLGDFSTISNRVGILFFGETPNQPSLLDWLIDN